MPAPISNYEKSQDAAARAFLRYDQSAMIRKFDLSHDADALYITFVDRPHRVDRHTGLVTVVSTGEKADFNAAMSIYDLLCDSQPLCHLSHEWVNVASLSAIQGGTLAKSGDLFLISAADFTGQTAALDRACRALHGIPRETWPISWPCSPFCLFCCAFGTPMRTSPPVCRYFWTKTP